MPVIPYVKQGAPFVDTAGASGTFNAAKANAMDAGIFEAMQQPAVRVFHNTTQSLTTATLTALAFNSERFDQAGGSASTMHDTVTNNTRLTALYAGIYQVSGTIEFAANSTGDRAIAIRVGPTGPTIIAYHQMTAAASGNSRMSISTIYNLAVNDYFELMAFQTSGAGLNVTSTANYSPEFGMVRVA